MGVDGGERGEVSRMELCEIRPLVFFFFSRRGMDCSTEDGNHTGRQYRHAHGFFSYRMRCEEALWKAKRRDHMYKTVSSL